MIIEFIRYDFWKFLVMNISTCFLVYMARVFWVAGGDRAQLICFILLLFVSFQVFAGLWMVSRKRLEEIVSKIRDMEKK